MGDSPAPKQAILNTGSPTSLARTLKPLGDADVPWVSVAQSPNTWRTYQPAVCSHSEFKTTYGGTISPRKAYPPSMWRTYHQAVCSHSECKTNYSGSLSPRKVASPSAAMVETGNALPVLLGTPINRMSYQAGLRTLSPSALQSEGMMPPRVASPSSNQKSIVESSVGPISRDKQIANHSPRPAKRGFADCVHKVTAQALREFRKKRPDRVNTSLESRFDA